MHLRMKLTLLYTGVLSLVLVVLTTVLYLATAHTLYKEVDEGIAARAASVIKSIRIEGAPLPLREIILPDVDVFASPDTYLQAVDVRGRVVARSDNLGGQYLPLGEYTLQSALRGDKFYETVLAGGQEIRVYNVPLVVEGRLVGLLQVGRALSTIHALLGRMRFFIALVGTAAVLLAGLLGWFLARTVLSPLERVTQTASSIENGSDLSRRIDYAGPADELGRLVYTLNAMFERLEIMYHRLEESYELQRRFVSDASHELRTPLTSIRGNAELLLKIERADPSLVREALNDIVSEARRLTRLVQDLLALARADAGFNLEKKSIPLADILKEVERKAQFLAGDKEFSFANHCPAETLIMVNSDYFSQLLFILLDNAFKYSPPGSSVNLTAQDLPNGFVEIAVTDRGPGLAPGEENRIFDRFYRGEGVRGREGSGLGLAIARWIVEQHNGTIHAANRPGGGSKFTIRLPVIKNIT
ncbi:ATP-binding protein [Desulfoscipio geothermicus]|uniref:histidine kinase n=1 Tax=Desulfoscipio geothermicus DSM 3669 TaxID=1121426 RepID=A0A1I6DP14_9FIRM|nr:ATP-binding protein [Desulfoscipio geothermicus]SFR07156.1 HAMP domain-containing protein [Desulfoscipio geothermicus DSM 3669]